MDKIDDFNVADFGGGLKDHEAAVFETASPALNPNKGEYLSLNKEQKKDLATKGVPETELDEIIEKLNMAIVERVEETLPDEYKKVLAAIRKGVKPNSEGYYTEDVSYAVTGKQLGMGKDEVEHIMWQLNHMKLVLCYVTGASYDSFDVRPWHPDKKIRAIRDKQPRGVSFSE